MADSYLEKQNKHQVYLSRLAGGILKDDIYPAINAAYRAARLAYADFDDIKSLQDLNRVNKAVTKAINEELEKGFIAATSGMNAIAVNEAAYQASALGVLSDTVLNVPGESKINKYVRDSIMTLESGSRTNAAVWADYVKGYESSMSRQYNAIITSAYSESLNTGEMATLNQLSQRFRALNNDILARDAETLIRTGVQHYAQQASNLMVQDSLDIIDREMPVVTFDSRTSNICMSISGKYPGGWKVGKSPIGYPPYHYQCRTIILPMLKGQTELEGTRSVNGADGGSQIDAKTPFSKWLRNQPESFVVETLGKKRADLFLSGKLSLANLTDKYLNPLPISKLKLSD